MNTGTLNLHDNGLNVKIEGVTIASIDIPSDYVPRNFAPVLGTHLLLAGDKLKEGMIVLLEDNLHRRDLPEDGRAISDYEQRNLDENSRWALVTDLRINRNGPDSRLVKFTAIYADGTMRDRTFNVSYKWAVLQKFEANFVCPRCGLVHSMADDKAPDIDETPEFPDFLKDVFGIVLGRLSGGFFDEIIAGLDEDEDEQTEVNDDEPRLDETPAEFLERMRDKAEERGEYSQDEVAKLRNKLSKENGRSAPAPLTGLSDLAALQSLRVQLRGE